VTRVPAITDPPPADVRDQVDAYKDALADVVPPKRSDNLLIGTWNVRAFNRLTTEWRSKTGDSPVRDLSNVLCIAETLRRFDVVAVQEVGSTAEAIKATMSHLGGDWAFLVTDVTLGDAGNHERLAFVFDRERLRPSGLACELVLAPEDFGVTTDVLGRQFARTPYGVSFAREPNVFTLVTLHVVYGNAPGDRVGELANIAGRLGDHRRRMGREPDRARRLQHRSSGRRGRRRGRAVQGVHRHRAQAAGQPEPRAPNDHRRPGPDRAGRSPALLRSDRVVHGTAERAAGIVARIQELGMFDFTQGLVPSATEQELSFRMSDHFPLWVEFEV